MWITQRVGRAGQHQGFFVGVYTDTRWWWRLNIIPCKSQRLVKSSAHRLWGNRHQGQRGNTHFWRNRAVTVHLGPAKFRPADRRQAGFSAQSVVNAAFNNASVTVKHHPVAAIVSLNHVAVAEALNGVLLTGTIYMCHNRIGRITVIRTSNVVAARNGYGMRFFCASLGRHQIIPAVLFVNVWAFCIAPAFGRPNRASLIQHFSGFNIDFIQGESRVDDVHFAVVIEEQVRVNMRYVYPDRIRPGAGWVICCHDKIPTVAHVGGNNIKRTVVVAQGNGEDVHAIG